MDFSGIHLKRDGIKEALLEIRFDAHIGPEAVVGRLLDSKCWRELDPKRMPSADIPQQLRALDENLRFAPSYELSNASLNELIRIGPNSLSYHRLAPYVGWSSHRPNLELAVSNLFSTLVGLDLKRLGFRYVNALNADDHMIASAADLNLKVVAGSSFVPSKFALNYRRHDKVNHIEQVQVATPDYVQPSNEAPFSVLIDIDIFTSDAVSIKSVGQVTEWIDIAHDALKDNFFRLLPEKVIYNLRAQ